MADRVTNTVELKLVAGFADEDDRTLTLPNPRGDITPQQLHELETLAAPVLIGDKYGAAFTRWKLVTKVYKARTVYDVTND